MQSRAKEMLEKQLDDANARMESAGREALTIQAKLDGVKEAKGMDKWRGFHFESSSGLTEEFASFSREYHAWMKKHLPIGAKLVEWNRGHFYCSGFIERAGKFVYFSFSDVRFFPCGWHDNILIRTAKGAKDYTGGANRNCRMDQFTQVVDDLLNREG